MTEIPDEVPAASATFPITNGWLAVMGRDRRLVSGAGEFRARRSRLSLLLT